MNDSLALRTNNNGNHVFLLPQRNVTVLPIRVVRGGKRKP